VCAYYEQVMRRQLLPIGRLSYYPMAQYLGDNVFRTPRRREHTISVRRRIVNATYLLTVVPSMQPPPFALTDGVEIVAPNALAGHAAGP
jgi:hypothetical protein